jgi:hypothetical protein
LNTNIKNIKNREKYIVNFLEKIIVLEKLIQKSKLKIFEKDNILTLYDTIKYRMKNIIVDLMIENNKLIKELNKENKI